MASVIISKCIKALYISYKPLKNKLFEKIGKKIALFNHLPPGKCPNASRQSFIFVVKIIY